MREPQRRQSSPTTMGKLQRHSSRQKMDDLQREVDLALEFFSQEEENELDHFIGDDYLHRHGKYQRGEKVQFHGGRPCSSDECDDSFPGTAATSMVTSVFTDDHTEFSDCHTKLLPFAEQSSPSESEPQMPRISGAGLSLKHRTKSMMSLPLSLLPSQTALNCSIDEEDASFKFENVIAEELNKVSMMEEEGKNRHADFYSNSSLRNAMEPFLVVARTFLSFVLFFWVYVMEMLY